MAKKVAIIYSDKAFKDIDRIIDFNNTRNQSATYSKKFLSGIKARLNKLAQQPFSGLKTDADESLLIWDDYYIFYLYDGLTIQIKSIFHQKENISR